MVLQGKTLTANTDYTVGYSNNVNAGTARVTVTGKGNCTGTATADFTITPVTTTNGNITVVDGGSSLELTIQDMGNQQGNTLPEDLAVTKLNYYRTLNASNANAYTVCLPYAPSNSANLKYYTLAGADGTTLQFNEITGAPQANTPYLVIASATTDIGTENLTANITMSKTVGNSSSADGYELKGTLSGISHANAKGFYILQPGKRWGKVVADKTAAYVPPCHAYIEATSAGARETLESSFGDDSTGIQNIRTVDRDGTERWYDLNGHRIEKPATKGVFIQNGQVVVVK